MGGVARWVLVALVLAGCTSEAPPAEETRDGSAAGTATTAATTTRVVPAVTDAEAVEVHLNIFSGMPNPRWELTAAQVAEFLAKVASLPETAPLDPTNRLGYQGFIARVRHKADETVVVIQSGVLEATRGGTATYRRDPGRGVERWLLDTGRPVVDPALVALVDGELAK